jgi:hypothetical protein
MPFDSDQVTDWLHSLPFPRPFLWMQFVYVRRATYIVVTLFTLMACVGIPIWKALGQMRNYEGVSHLVSYQVGLFFGALIVVSFARISYAATKLFDDCKWLSRFGAVGEANLLWVLGDENGAVITYRFWDLQGRERQRETVVAPDNGRKLPVLCAGDMIPVLFDPHHPDARNLLWIEITRYVRIAPAVENTLPAPPTGALA